MASSPRPDAVTSLRATLLEVKVPMLKAIARSRGTKVRGVSRDAVAAEIVELLLDAGVNSALLSAATPVQRAVLALLLLGKGKHTPRSLSTRHLAQLLGSWGVKAAEVDAAVVELSGRGLLLPLAGQERDVEPTWQVNAAVEPLALPLLPSIQAFGGSLPASPPRPADLAVPDLLARLDAVVEELDRARDYRLPFRDLREYRGLKVRRENQWLVVGNPPPRGTRTNLPKGEPRIGVQIVPPNLLLPEDAASRLASAAGLSGGREAELFLRILTYLNIGARGEEDWGVDAAAWRSFRALPARRRAEQIVGQVWGEGVLGEIDLLHRYDPRLSLWLAPSYHYVDMGTLLPDTVRVRYALLALLAWLPVGSWYDLDSFLDALRRCYPELPLSLDAMVPAWQNTVWWLQRSDGEAAPGVGYLERHSADGWRQGLGRLLVTALVGPLTWLGLVEVAGAGGAPVSAGDSCDLDAAAAFRLTELGGLFLSARPVGLLGIQPPLAAESAGQPIMELDPGRPGLIHTRNLALDARLALAAFADPILQTPLSATYSLTIESAGRGFDAGLDPRRMLDLLAPLRGDGAVRLRDELAGWWEAYGRLHIFTGVALIELGDDFVRSELLAGTRLADYILYEISPRLLVVREEDVDAVAAMLQKAGQAARVVDGASGGGIT